MELNSSDPRRSLHFRLRVVQVTFIHMESFTQQLRHVVSETSEFIPSMRWMAAKGVL